MAETIRVPLAFIDTETTGLRDQDQVWGFFGVRREPDGHESRLQLFIDHDPALADSGLPLSLWIDHQRRFGEAVASGQVVSPLYAALAIVEFLEDRGTGVPHLVGLNPAFGAAHLRALLGEFALAVPWHNHLIDVEALALGAARARGVQVGVPFAVSELAAAFGVPEDLEERHTARGDVGWTIRLFDAVWGPSPAADSAGSLDEPIFDALSGRWWSE